MISAEEWDTRYWRIYDDLVRDGEFTDDTARHMAEDECSEQFGDRPAEETT